MAETLWNGVVNVRRLAIPVGVAATKTDGNEVAFKTLHRECQTPIGLRAWCPFHERVLEAGELVKAAELADGQLVLVEQSELEPLTPEDSRAIDVFATVKAEDLDPLLVRSVYYLTPGKQPTLQRPYALLSEALAQTDTVALARFVRNKREQYAAITPHGDRAVLLLQVLRFAEDVVTAAEVDDDFSLAGVHRSEQESDLARELILRMLTPAPKLKLISAQRAQLRDLIAAKLAGQEIVHPARPEPADQLPPLPPDADLAGALEQSIREIRKPKARPKGRAKHKTKA